MSKTPDTKICSGCGEVLSLTMFHLSAPSRDGRNSKCKACRKAIQSGVRNTKEGLQRQRNFRVSSIDGWLAFAIYKMKAYSRKRGHRQPEIRTREDLLRWLSTQPFMTLWLAYYVSNYDVKLRPSIDRLDNSRGYELTNIRLVSWGENWASWTLSEDGREHCRTIGRMAKHGGHA